MQHLDEGTIHSWLDGALSAEEAARVEAHLKDCAQCQAAVAEARGFIAASSRILTALDNAPRGVIPAAAPKKRIDPMIWKIAATVLVVAGGTVVVVRNSGLVQQADSKGEAVLTSARETAPMSRQAETLSTAPTAAAQLPETPAATNGSAASAGTGAAVKAKVSRPPAAVDMRGRGRIVGEAASPDAAAANQNAGAVGGRNPTLEGRAVTAAPQRAPAPSPRFEAAPLRAADVAALDAATDESPLRAVGTPPRSFGRKLTYYEIAPGDTVTLSEEFKTQLLSAVVTGMAQPAAAGGAVRRDATSKAAATAERAQAPVAQAPAVTPSAPPPPPPSPPSAPAQFVESSDGNNTLAWTDPTTGSVMKLSGRHSRVELEGIKRRIERLRAAAADSARKNR